MIKYPPVFHGLYYKKDEKLIKHSENDAQIKSISEDVEDASYNQSVNSTKWFSWFEKFVNSVKVVLNYANLKRFYGCKRDIQDLEMAMHTNLSDANNIFSQNKQQNCGENDISLVSKTSFSNIIITDSNRPELLLVVNPR